MSAAPAGGSSRKRTGRRAGPTVSNRLILDIARRQFGAHGYEGATMRTIAQEAEVDTALIHHFFLTKEGLFDAAVRDALTPPDLLSRAMDGPRGRVGERTVQLFFTFWDEPSTQVQLAGVLRSVTSLEGAAEAVRRFLGDEVLCPLAEALGQPEPRLRAAMVGSQLIGLAIARYLYEIESVTTLNPAELAALSARTFQTYLTGAL